ncbi:hypothetical protein LDFHOB_11540 [Candidatus Electronema aureum]
MISHPKKLPLFCQDKEQRGGIGKNSMPRYRRTLCLHTVQRHACMKENSMPRYRFALWRHGAEERRAKSVLRWPLIFSLTVAG